MKAYLIKAMIAYCILFPAIGLSMVYIGVEHVAYYASFGAVYSQLIQAWLDHEKD